MKLWIDDVRSAPIGHLWVKSVKEAMEYIELYEYELRVKIPVTIEEYDKLSIELIDLDHDAGNYASDGGDYIRLLDWLEETGRNYPIHIHSMNPVGVQNMRAIIQKNGWVEVK